MSVNTHGLTDQELAALTPAEREALLDEPSEDEKTLAAGGPGVKDAAATDEADPLKDKPKTVLVDDDAEGDPAKKTEAAKTEGADDGKAKEEASTEEEADDGPLAVPLHAREIDPEKVKAARDEIAEKAKTDLAEVMTKYEAGELDQSAMLEKRDEINGQKHQQLAAIDRAVQESDLSKRHEVQVKTSLWEREVKGFLREHQAYRTDVLYDALDGQVKKIAADPANANMTDRQILEQAHKNLSSVMKVDGDTAPVDPKKAAEDALKAAKDKRKPDLSSVPKTLHGIPAAAPQAAEAEEFAHLDVLSAKAEGGDAEAQAALEREIAKMSPAQQDRWARAA